MFILLLREGFIVEKKSLFWKFWKKISMHFWTNILQTFYTFKKSFLKPPSPGVKMFTHFFYSESFPMFSTDIYS